MFSILIGHTCTTYKRTFNEEAFLFSLSPIPLSRSPTLTFHILSKAVCALTMCFINGNSGNLFTLFYNLLFSLFYLEDLYKYTELPFSFLQLHNIPHNHLYWHFILDFFLFFPINSLYSIWESTVVVWNILDILNNHLC